MLTVRGEMGCNVAAPVAWACKHLNAFGTEAKRVMCLSEAVATAHIIKSPI